MIIQLDRVKLQVVYDAIAHTPGAAIERWWATEPDYGESDIFVSARVSVPNEFSATQLRGEYDRLLEVSA